MSQRKIISLILVALLVFGVPILVGVPAAYAQSDPVITGQAAGTEWCFQFLCGFAAFSGVFKGAVDGKPTKGSFTVVVEHAPLPTTAGGTAAIEPGGTWSIVTKKDAFYGTVTEGLITNNDNNIPDTFVITATLQLDPDSSGSGTIYFSGLLDHNDFPPTIAGAVLQSLVP